MAKAPDQPAAPKRARDPAKHSKKDPAKPTRAKAARPDEPPTDPALADLLNPGIGQGTAGPGRWDGTVLWPWPHCPSNIISKLTLQLPSIPSAFRSCAAVRLAVGSMC